MGRHPSRKGTNVLWTLDKIREGFLKFYELKGVYPRAYDIDDFEFLPSSRQIQRSFGGLVNLRKLLGLEINSYSTGKERSKIATSGNKKGRILENDIAKILQDRFGEQFVHIEKPINNNFKNRYDFYVYAKPINFAVDVFSTSEVRNLIKNINIKEKKYSQKGTADAREPLYFVYLLEKSNESMLSNWIQNRKNKIRLNWKLMSSDEFKKEIFNYSNFISN